MQDPDGIQDEEAATEALDLAVLAYEQNQLLNAVLNLDQEEEDNAEERGEGEGEEGEEQEEEVEETEGDEVGMGETAYIRGYMVELHARSLTPT